MVLLSVSTQPQGRISLSLKVTAPDESGVVLIQASTYKAKDPALSQKPSSQTVLSKTSKLAAFLRDFHFRLLCIP